MPVTFNFSNVSGTQIGSRFVTSTTFTSMFPTDTTVNTGVPTSMGGTTTTTMTLFSTRFFPGITTTGNSVDPLVFTSSQTGVGLPGGTMVFTLSAESAFYEMSVSAIRDEVEMNVSPGIGTNTGTYLLTFDAGNGLTRLSNVAIVTSSGSNVVFETGGGGTVSAGAGFTGEITGIRFVTLGSVALISLTGTLSCFAEGTRIAARDGAVEVQNLAIGDTILTADGETRDVKWIGRRTIDVRFGLPERLRPVRVQAGALGAGAPERDLVLTADHALLVDGMLVEARALVDGDAVRYLTPAEMGERFTVYHIETEDHAVVVAEGAPAETFIDYAGRQQFDNHAEYLGLYGADQPIAEAPTPRVTRVPTRQVA